MTVDSSKVPPQQIRRELESSDFEVIDQYSIRCKLCDDFSFCLFLSPEEFVFHVSKSHSMLSTSANFESELRTVFVSRVKTELVELEFAPPTFVTPTCTRCTSCGKRVGLETPYSPENFIKHMRENSHCHTMKNKSEMGNKKSKETPIAPKKEPPNLRVNSLRAKRLSSQAASQSVKAISEPKTAKKKSTNFAVSKKIENKKELREQALAAYKKSTCIYRYLRNEPPIFRRKNLSYMQLFQPERPKRKASPPILFETSAKCPKMETSRSPTPEEPECKLVFESVRDNLLPTGSKWCTIELLLRKIVKNKIVNTEVVTTGSIGLNNENRKFEICLPLEKMNGVKYGECWIIIKVTVPSDEETCGGRSLRNVPQRQSLRASTENLREKNVESRKKSALNSSETVLISQRLLCNKKGDMVGLYQGSFQQKLISLTDIGKSIDSAEFSPILAKLIQNFQEGPFVKLSIYRRLDESDEDQSDRNADSAPPTLEHFTNTKPVIPVKHQIPPRLLYRVCLEQCWKAVKDGFGTGYSSEAKDSQSCPWCKERFDNLWLFLTHLTLQHPRFQFLYNPGTSQDIPTITVFISSIEDFRLETAPARPANDRTAKRPSKNQIFFDVLVTKRSALKFRQDLSQKQLMDFAKPEKRNVFNRMGGHIRQYYHSQTCLPIEAGDDTSDSEGENDPEWLREYVTRNLEEFTDLNSGEKSIMNLWNMHLLKHPNLANKQIYETCVDWLKVYGQQIVQSDLINNCLVHFATLAQHERLDTKQFSNLSQMLKNCRL